MKKFAKLFLVLTLVVLIARLVAACGESGSSTGGGEQTTVTEEMLSAELERELQANSILENVTFDSVSRTINATVSYSNQIFDIWTVNLDNGYSFSVYSDPEYSFDMGHRIELRDDENVFYVKVFAGDVTVGYTFVINKRPHDHVFGDWGTVYYPTCIAPGRRERTCSCGEVESEVIEPLGHDSIHHDGQEPTCTEIGWTAYETCSRCDYTTYEEIEPLGHNYVDEYCSRCGEKEPQAMEGLVFTLMEDDTYEVTCYTGNATDVIIKNLYENKPVTRIGNNAFFGCESLLSITLPDSVTSIAEGAFSGCPSLESIVIPFVGAVAGKTSEDTYQYPFGYIFGDCDCGYDGRMRAVEQYYYGPSTLNKTSDIYYIPYSLQSVTVMGGDILCGAFWQCTMLTTIIISNDIGNIEEDAFSGCTAEIVWGDNPAITTIGNHAFSSYEGEDLTIPDSVTSIGEYAFLGCWNLKSIKIPDRVTSIGYEAFAYCKSLADITIPDSVTSIGDRAFMEDNSLLLNEYNDAYYIGNEKNPYLVLIKAKDTSIVSCSTHSDTKFINTSAFSDCSLLTNVVLGENVVSIGYMAFGDCPALDIVSIPGNVTRINEEAFHNCVSLSSVYYTGDIASWCGIEFGYGDANPLKYAQNFYINGEIISGDLVLPNTVTKIPDFTFRNSQIAGITIPESVTDIGECAFQNTSLKSATIPARALPIIKSYSLESITFTSGEIPARAFQYHPTLRSVTIGDDVTTIWGEAFHGCVELTNAIIGNGTKEIGAGAFSGCSDLTSVTIGSGVTNVGENAFNNCTGLTSVLYTGDINSWCGIAFNGYTANPLCYASNLYIDNKLVTELVIPEDVSIIRDYAFAGASCLTSVTIPDSVTDIKGDAFIDCNIKTATIPGKASEVIKNDTLLSVTITSGEIPSYAFSGCNCLASVVIDDSVASIGEGAFQNCPIEEAKIPSIAIVSITNDCLRNATITSGEIPDRAFMNRSNLITLAIDDHVTGIGEKAFSNSGLTAITLAGSVKNIANSAFDNCSKLVNIYYTGDIVSWMGITFGNEYSNPLYYAHNLYIDNELFINLDIPDGVTEIKDYAFYGASNLKSITIPDSVVKIGNKAFGGRAAINDVYYEGDLSSWCDITFGKGYDSNPFSRNHNLYIDKEPVIRLIIPDSVTEIKDYAFSGVSCLKDVTISENVTRIGTESFSGCIGFTSITIPKCVSSIGSNAFYGCNRLVEVYNKSSLEIVSDSRVNGYVGYYAENVYSEEGGSKLSIDEDGYILYTDGEEISLVGYNGKETDLILPAGITGINQYAFYCNKRITSITIPDSVTSISNYAFYNITSLTTVVIGEGLTSIEEYAFFGCNKLLEVYNKSSLDIQKGSSKYGYVGYYSNNILSEVVGTKFYRDENGYILFVDGEETVLFGYVGTDTELILPECVTKIHQSAFSYNKSIVSVIIPGSLKTIGFQAFYECTSLTSVTICEGVQTIGDGAFYNCILLKGITIPDSVTSIGREAFYNCASIESLTIGSGVKGIRNNTFSYCTALKDVTFGENVTNIEYYAFYECISLTSITLSDSVTNIGYDAFDNCISLTSVDIGCQLTNIGSNAFKNCPIAVATIPAKAIPYIEKKRLLTVEITCGDIPSQAFYNCTALTSLTIGRRVTSIGRSAFAGCNVPIIWGDFPLIEVIGEYAFSEYKGTSIVVPDSVKKIEKGAFYNCAELTNVTIGAGVTSIGDNVFGECTSLASVCYTGDIAAWCGIQFSDYYSNPLRCAHNLFINNELVADLDIPNGVKEITDYAFFGATCLTSVIIGNDVTRIGDRAFLECTGLISADIGNNVTSIGERAFSDCTGLTEVLMGNKVTSIGSYAFSNVAATVVWGYAPTIRTIGYGAFSEYKGSSFTIPDGVMSIQERAFYGCTNLMKITVPNSVSSVGQYAFDECLSLQYNEYENALYLGNRIYPNVVLIKAKNTDITSCMINVATKVIYSFAFSGCKLLEDVTIPYNVHSINNGAFRDCIGLSSISIGDRVTSIGAYAFSGCTGLTSITLPDSVMSIGGWAFSGCTGLTRITIPDSVKSIEANAFQDCSGLTSVYYTGDVASWCGIAFSGYNSNPLYCSHNLYIDEELVTELIIPDSVTRIKDYAFYGATCLTSVTIPDSVTRIGISAFSGCSIKTATIPAIACSQISNSALQSVTITSGKHIEDHAFDRCTSFTNITLPDSVTSIGESAFNGCTGLTSVYYTGDVASWCGIAFSNYNSNPLYYAHNLYIDEELITELVIPDSVTSIGRSAINRERDTATKQQNKHTAFQTVA